MGTEASPAESASYSIQARDTGQPPDGQAHAAHTVRRLSITGPSAVHHIACFGYPFLLALGGLLQPQSKAASMQELELLFRQSKLRCSCPGACFPPRRPESYGVLDHVTRGDLLNFLEDGHLRKSDVM